MEICQNQRHHIITKKKEATLIIGKKAVRRIIIQPQDGLNQRPHLREENNATNVRQNKSYPTTCYFKILTAIKDGNFEIGACLVNKV